MSWQMGDFGALESKQYTVVPGDSLSLISMRFFGDYKHVQEIADANGIADVNKIYVGQVLVIPNVPVKSESPPITSPILVPLPMPTPPAYELPYTKPIALPEPVKEIPYTQPITLPVEPKPVPAPAPVPVTGSAQSSVPIFGFLKNIKTTDKVLGLSLVQWAAVVGLGGLAIGLFASMGGERANPRRKRR